MQRHSGILLPVASLPSPYGIGDLGPGAFRFLDWLVDAGQHVWEVLPLLIPDDVGSPFASPSAFAGNWMLVSPDRLYHAGYLRRMDFHRVPAGIRRTHYGRVNRHKRNIIGMAWFRFRSAQKTDRERFAQFCQNERWWLDDYTLFMAIKDRQSGKPWWQWPNTLRHRDRAALRIWGRTHKKEREYFAFGQWLFHEQWNTLKHAANKKKIRILGDLPFFLVHDSVDVWANRHLFLLNHNGLPQRVSGAPPDAFYHKGQVWGDPLYRWSVFQKDRFHWWNARVQKALSLYDDLRFDHFRGFEATWSIPSLATDAKTGRWYTTPGRSLLSILRRSFPRATFYAEDLGNVNSRVYALRDAYRFIGMRIAQFGPSRGGIRLHDPQRYPVASIAYTGTHDMPTLCTWLTNASRTHRAKNTLTAWKIIRNVLASRSKTAIIPFADVLELDDDARINRPGQVDPRNWTWRLSARQLTRSLTRKLKRLTRLSGR